MCNSRLRIAIQKKGYLYKDSVEFLKNIGIYIQENKNNLIYKCENFPIDILFVRDDDIPNLINNKICDLAIIGENVLIEYMYSMEKLSRPFSIKKIFSLGFGSCRLSIAAPKNFNYLNKNSIKNLKIATSYPNILEKYLKINQLNSEIIFLSGSVEIAPDLLLSDLICDLVSSGKTLQDNNL